MHFNLSLTQKATGRLSPTRSLTVSKCWPQKSPGRWCFKRPVPSSVALLARSGFVIATRPETLITTQQIYDREVYIVLKGEFVAMVNGKFLCNYEPGDVFGVESFFASDGLTEEHVLVRWTKDNCWSYVVSF